MRSSTFVRSTCIVWALVLASSGAIASEPASEPASAPDWSAIAGQSTVHVITADPDGDARETKIWVVVLDGVGYIRTSQTTTWGDNVQRNPDIALRVEGREYPLRASFVVDGAERKRIVEKFVAKYGNNPLMNLIRGSDPRIMRLQPR
jgi:hypothetical protein